MWTGTLKEGNGEISLESKAFHGKYTFASRFETGPGTNPEELVGGAHAGCYSMFLSALLSGKSFNPTSITTTAVVTLGQDDIGPKITKIELNCTAVVPNLSQAEFDELAKTAKANCPISRLYAGTEIVLNATLA